MAYLDVDDQGTYIDITCDGYVVRVHTDGSDAFLVEIHDPDNLGTVWATLGSKVDVSSTTYALSEDTGISVTIKEQNSNRCVIHAIGDFEDSAQSSLANESGSSIYLYIYDDRIVQHVEFVASGSITLDNSAVNGICFCDLTAANVASEDAAYENSGSETTATSDGEQNSADYLLLTSTEINILGCCVSESNTGAASFGQYLDDPADGAMRFRWNNGTITSGTALMTVVWVFDSADRSGGKAYSTEASRIALGDQWKDTDCLSISGGFGAMETDWSIPDHIATGFCSDGAFHAEYDSDSTIKVTAALDMTKATVVLEPQFNVGTPSSPTDLKVGHWPCEDDAANTTIVDATGNNNGTLAGGNTTDNLTDADSRRSACLKLDGTDDHIDLDDALGELTSTDKFTVLIDVKPWFAYNTSNIHALVTIGSSSTDRISIYYNNAVDRFILQNDIQNAGDVNNLTSVFTADLDLQKYVTLILAVDLTKNIIYAEYGGERLLIDAPNDWSAAPTLFKVGADDAGAYDGQYHSDDVKLINACVLPYGAYFTDEGNSYDNPHEDITCFVKGDESNSDSLNIGTGTITVTGATHAEDPWGNASGAFLIDAGGEYVTVPDENLSLSNFSVGFWFLSTGDITNSPFITAQAGYEQLSLYRYGTSNALSCHYNGTQVFSNTSVSDIWDGRWHYIVFKLFHDGTDVNIWVEINKTEEISDSATVSVETTYGTSIIIGGTTTVAVGGRLSDITFTDDIGTPQIRTAFGHGPLLLSMEDKT